MPDDNGEAQRLARQERDNLNRAIRLANLQAQNGRNESRQNQQSHSNIVKGLGQGLANAARKFSSADKARQYLGNIKNGITGPLGFLYIMVIAGIGIVLSGAMLWYLATMGTMALYDNYSLVCKDSLATSIQVNEMKARYIFLIPAIFFQNTGFGMCMLNALFKEMIIDAKWYKNWKFGNFLDNQIMKATDTRYVTELDENEKEPVGVFIEDLTVNNDGYFADEDFRIGATIRVKTIATKIEGSAECTINDIPSYSQFPNGGTFISSKSDVLPIIWCDFRKNQNIPGLYPATFKIQSKMTVFGHMLPIVTTRTFYDELSDKNKEQLQTRLEGVGLKTSNTPVQIGSIINGEKENLILVEKKDMIKGYTTIPLGFTLDTEGWDDGKVVRFHNLFISLPLGMELEDKNKDYAQELANKENIDTTREDTNTANTLPQNEQQDTVIACGGYTFKKVNDCNGLNQAMSLTNSKDNTNFLCDNSNTVYMLQTNEEYKQIGSFDNRREFLCGVVAPIQELFEDEDGNPLAFRAVPIKIYGTYTFEIKRTTPIKINAGKTQENAKLIQYACDQTTIASLQNQQQTIPQATIETYAKKYQQKIRTALRSTTQKLPIITDVQAEALLAAMSQKYSGFTSANIPLSSNQQIYITGCKSGNENIIVTPEEDLKCTVAVLRTSLTTNSGNIEDSLEQYYSAPERSNLYVPATTATIADYNAWLKVLCKSAETTPVLLAQNNNTQTTTTNPQTNLPTIAGTKQIDISCSNHEECVTNLCRTQPLNLTKNPTGGSLCIPCAVTAECNPDSNDLRKNLICVNQQCIVG